MFDLEVFDVSVLRDVGLQAWSDDNAFREVLSSSAATTSSDGHLVLRPKLVSSQLRSNIFELIARRGDRVGMLLLGGLYLKIFYRDALYLGNFLHLEKETHSDYKVPYVFGEFNDQQR